MNSKTTFSALKDKEVISTTDGRRFGYVCDADIDIQTGRLCAIIVPGELKLFGLSRCQDYVIPWECIAKIGNDVILVDASRVMRRDKAGIIKKK